MNLIYGGKWKLFWRGYDLTHRCGAHARGQRQHCVPRVARARATAGSRGRAAIDLHAQSAPSAGGQRGAQDPGVRLFGLPKMLLPVALRHQHVDYLNARRVQTLMHVHGSGQFHSEPDQNDPQLVDLNALAAEGNEGAQANVA